MKNVIVTICLMMFLCILACNSKNADNNFRLWLASHEATELRAGYLIDPNTEVGPTLSFWDGDEEPKTFGAYALRHLTDVVIKVPNPVIMDGLPENLEGTPYFGARIYRDCQEERTAFSPLSGVKVEPFFFEGRLNSAEPSTLIFGIFLEF